MKAVAALVALVALAGCSFLAVTGPPSQRPPGGQIHCTESYALPIIDGAFATFWSVALVAMLANDDAGPIRDVMVPMAVFGMLPYAISSTLGSVDVSRCRRAKREMPAASPPIDAERKEARARAWTLTKEAGDAARAGDCASVKKLDAEVGIVDVDFHDTVFVRDAAIARCLAASSAAPSP